MTIFVPYNEHLPCYRAHDVYLAKFCDALAGEKEVVWAFGHQSLPQKALFFHYGLTAESLRCLLFSSFAQTKWITHFLEPSFFFKNAKNGLRITGQNGRY